MHRFFAFFKRLLHGRQARADFEAGLQSLTIAVFSMVDRILFRRLPYSHADRLVSVGLKATLRPEELRTE